MMQLEDFFGLDFNIKRFEVNTLLDLLGIRRKIEQLKQVALINERFGAHSAFTDLAKRQQVLKYFKPLLDAPMLDYDSLHYVKEVNTASTHDRRYNAEDRLLEFNLIVAAGKTPRELQHCDYKPNLQVLRSVPDAERFDRLWDVLSRESKEVIDAFREAR